MNYNVLEILKEKKTIMKLSMTALVGAVAVYGGTMFSASAMKPEVNNKSTSEVSANTEDDEVKVGARRLMEMGNSSGVTSKLIIIDAEDSVPKERVGGQKRAQPSSSDEDEGSSVAKKQRGASAAASVASAAGQSEGLSDKDQAEKMFCLTPDKTCLKVRDQILNVTKINRIKEKLEECPTITELVLCENIMGANEVERISNILKENTTLHKLWIDRCEIGISEAVYIKNLIANNKTLEWLSLKGNNIDAEGAKNISAALRVNTTLQTLILNENDIGDTGANYIGEALKENTALKQLWLRRNNIKDKGANAIITAVECKKLGIEVHLFGDNLIVDRALEDRLKQNYESRKKALDSRLRSMVPSVSAKQAIPDDFVMDLQGTKLIVSLRKGKRNGDVQQIKSFLDQHSEITYLCLDDCNIGIDGAKMISEVLPTNTNLEELSLNRNAIKSQGAGYIADVLKTNTSLKILWLQGNGIGTVGVQRISNMIQENNTLEKLSLSENRLNDEDVRLLSEALKKNTKLKSLWLNQNEISSKGARFILSALETNKVLEWVDLIRNEIESRVFYELRQKLRCRSALAPSVSSSIPKQQNPTVSGESDSAPAASATELSVMLGLSGFRFGGAGSVPEARAAEESSASEQQSVYEVKKSLLIGADDSWELKSKIKDLISEFKRNGQTDEDFVQFTKQCMDLINKLKESEQSEMLIYFKEAVISLNK